MLRRLLIEQFEPRVVLAATDADDVFNSTNAGEVFAGLGGNDTYVFSNNFGQDTVTEAVDKGTDILDFSRVTSNLIFNFRADGSVEVVDQSNNANRVVATNVETLIGGSGNDVYRAVEGSRGTYYLNEPNGGVDTVDFSALSTAVTFDLSKISEQTVSSNFKLTLSALNVFDNLNGGSANDTLSGNELDNIIAGGQGNDAMSGGDGDDVYVLADNPGNDSLTEAAVSGSGTDKLDFTAITAGVVVSKTAESNFRWVAGGNTITLDNIEVLAGGTGLNSLDFSASVENVLVNLAGGVSTDFTQLSGFRNVTGSRFADTIIGNDLDNILIGGDGDDVLSGGGGSDSLDAGPGSDRLLEIRDVNFTLTNALLTATGTGITGSEIDTLAGFEMAELRGGTAANIIDASAFTGPVTLDGGSRILLSLLNNGIGVRTTNVPQFDLSGATLLSSLNQGDGVRRVAQTDFRITLTDGATVDVDITPAMTTVQQVIDAITSAGNTVANGRLSVFIDPDTLNSIVLNDTIDGGGNLTVTALNNSAAAGDLGILREGSTKFLNGSTISETTNDLRVTLSDGTRLEFDLSRALLLDDLLDLLNTRSADFAARIDANGTGLILTDRSGGAGAFTATSLNGSSAAADLGITAAGAGGVIAGTSIVGSGNLRLDGRLDNDTLTGGSSDDTLIGGGGNDTLTGGAGLDTLVAHRDTNLTLTDNSLTYGSGDVATIGSIEKAKLTGGVSNNIIDASAFTLGSVTLDGDAGHDTLKGGSGNDFLTGGLGLDNLDGGAGTNAAEEFAARALVAGAPAASTLDLAEGANEVVTISFGGTVNGGTFNLTFDGQTTDAIPFNANARDLKSVLLKLRKLDDGDLIVSQPNIAGPWIVTFKGKEGGLNQPDITAASIDLTGGGNVNAAVTTQGSTILNQHTRIQVTRAFGTVGVDLFDGSEYSGSVFFSSGPGNDTLIGTAAADTLKGGEGDDRITGNGGNDTLEAGDGVDTLVESRDVSFTLTNTALTSTGGEVDTISGFERAELTGGAGANTIDVSAFSVVDSTTNTVTSETILDGGPGADTITGSPGKDRITGGLGTDSITAGAGIDTLIETRDADFVLTAANLTIGAELDTLSGFEKAELSGGASVNSIDARAFTGSVILSTGGGLDTLKGPASADAEYRIDVTGLTAPNAAGDTARQIRIEVGNLPSKTTIVIDQTDNSVTQSDLFWVNLIGSAASADYELRKRNRSLDVGHSFDEVLNVTENLVFAGKSVRLVAGTINVIGRTINTGSNIASGGNITLRGKKITVDGGSTLDSRTLAVGTGTTSGAIAIEAVEDRAQFTGFGFANVDLIDTEINIGAATIRGGAVTLTATADSSEFVQEGDFGEVRFISNFGTEIFSSTLQALESQSIGAAVGYSRSTAKIKVGTSAATQTIINADSLAATASSVVSIFSTPEAFNFSVAIGIAKTESIVDLANATITTVGDLSIHSKTDHTVNIEGKAENDPYKTTPVLGFGISVLSSNSSATVGRQALLNVGRDLFVQAETVDLNSNSAEASASPAGSFALAVAVSVEKGNTLAAIDGRATVTRNVNVTAKMENSESNIGASAEIKGEEDGEESRLDKVLSFFGDANNEGTNAEKAAAPFAFAFFSRIDFIDKVKDLFKGDEEFGPANKPDDINRKKTQGAVAVSVLEDTNNVTARIGSGVLNNAADVAQVDAGGFISVVSNIENRPDMTVGSSTEFDPETTTIDGGNVIIALVGEVNNGVSIAVGSTGIYDNADAFIAGNSTVNATGDLTVDAQTLNSLDPTSTFGTTLAAPFLDIAPDYTSSDGVKVINGGDKVEVAKNHSAGGEPGKTYRFTGLDGTQIDLANEDFSNDDRWEERVVESETTFGFLSSLTDYLDDNLGIDNNLVQFWVQATAGGQKKTSVAGSVGVVRVNHNADARIDTGARVNQNAAASFRNGSQEINVTSASDSDLINLGGQFNTLGINDLTEKKFYSDIKGKIKSAGTGGVGGEDTKSAVGATALVFFYNNDVKSRILDGAQVFGKALDVTAENSVNGITVGASGGQAAKNGFTGVGIYSAVDNHTIASVGGLATVNIQGDVSITATDSSILVGVAGSLVKSGKIGVGASFAVNEIERETRAFIGNALDNTTFNPGGSFTSTGKLDITASNDGFFGTFAAAGAKATNAKESEEKVGLAAAVGLAINLIDDDTRAYIQHATVSTTGAITLKSTAEPIVEAFSIGGAMSQSKLNSIALAGAASFNKIDSDTQAFIANSNDPGASSNDRRSVTSTGGGITVNATDSTLAFAHSGAVAIAWGQSAASSTASRSLSIGASIAINEIGQRSSNTVLAYIDNSTVTAAGPIDVAATFDGKYQTLAVGGSAAGAPGGATSNSSLAGAVAGAFSSNVLASTIKAYVQTSSVVVTGPSGRVSLKARNLAKLVRADGFGAAFAYAKAGKAGSSAGALSIGVGVGKNKSKNTVQAYIQNSTVDATGNIELLADDQSNLSALGVGAAASFANASGTTGAIAGAGSAGVNDLDNDTAAYIVDCNGAKFVRSTGGSITLSATDAADIVGVAGTLALALGVKTQGQGATVAVAVGVSVALNHIGGDGGHSVKSYIDNSVVTSSQNVSLTALSKASIFALAAGGSGAAAGSTQGNGIAGAFAGAGVGTENSIKQTILAAIQNNSVVTATSGSATLNATDSSSINADAGAVAIALALSTAQGPGISGSVGIAVALNTLENNVSANVSSSKLTAQNVSIEAASKKDPASTAGYRVDALAFGVAGSGSLSTANGAGGALAGAGSGARNKIDNTIQAFIKDSTGDNRGVTATAGGVSITASDDTSVRADSGGYALALGVSGGNGAGAGLAFGVSIALNDIGKNAGHSILAYVDNSVVQAGGPISITSTSTVNVDAQAIAGAIGAGGSLGSGFGLGLGGAGVGTVNTIEMDVHAKTLNNSTLNANGGIGSITISATDNTAVDANAIAVAIGVGLSGGGSAGALTVGISVALNYFANDVQASITGGNINGGGALTMTTSETAKIDALSVAPSISIAGSANNALALSGGAAISYNTILSKANTSITDAVVTVGGNASITATNTAEINAKVVSVALGIGAGGTNGGAAAIGASIAWNYLGYNSDGIKQTSEVRAFIKNSSLIAGGALALSATSNQRITADIDAVAGTIGVGGSNAIGLAGTAAYSENKIAVDVKAYVDGDGVAGLRSTTLSIVAADTSTINADAVGAAFALAASGSAAGTLTIGVSLARNEIANNIEAYFNNADLVVTTAGGITVSASEAANINAKAVAASLALSFSGAGALALAGAGAESTNVILSQTKAYAKSSKLDATGAVSVTASMTGNVKAEIVGVAAAVGVSGSAGLGVAIGASIGRNMIGFNKNGTRSSAVVAAYLENTGIVKATSLTVQATNNQTIEASVQSVAVAIAAAADGAVGLSGAGTSMTNELAVDVKAYIDGTGNGGINVGSISVNAVDQSKIDASAGAVAVAFSFAIGGASGSVGAALAENTVKNVVDASIKNAANLRTTTGGISILADEKADITAFTFTFSTAISISIGGSAAGALTTSRNVVETDVSASIVDSPSIVSVGAVNVEAKDTSKVKSTVTSVAGSGGLVGISLGVALANDNIENDVSAFGSNATITSNTGGIAFKASSTPTIESKNFVGALSLALGASVAGGNAISTIGGTTEAFVNASSLTAPNGTVIVNATSTGDARPNITGMSGGLVGVAAMTATTEIKGTTRTKLSGNTTVQSPRIDMDAIDTSTVKPNVLVAAVGGVAGAGAGSFGTVSRTTESFVETGARLNLNAAVLDISAQSNTMADGAAAGVVGGVISIAVLNVGSTVEGATRAYIGDGVNLTAGQVNVKADSTAVAKVPAEVFGVSLLGGNGIILNSTDKRAVSAYIGATTGTTSSTPTVVTVNGGGVDVDAKHVSTVEAKTRSVTIGLIAAAGTSSTATSQPTVLAYLGDKASVTAPAGSVAVDADSTVNASAKGSDLAAGAIAVSFATVSAVASPTAKAFTESNTLISALSGNITSTSKVPKLDSTFEASGGGLLDVRGATANATLTHRNTAGVGNNSNVATVNNFTVRSNSILTGTTNASNGGGGIAAVGLANAILSMDDETKTNIGGTVKIEVGGDLLIESIVSTTADSDASVKNGGLVASPQSFAKTTADIDVRTDIGTNADIRGENVTIRAESLKYDVDARAYSSVGAAVPIANSTAEVDGTSSAVVTIQANRPTDSITGRNNLRIISSQTDLSTLATAETWAGGFAGSASADSKNKQSSNSEIKTFADTRFGAGNLYVNADSDVTPSMTSNASRPGFVLIDAGSQTNTFSGGPSRTIDFPSKVRLLGAPGPSLKIDPNGKIVEKKGLTLNNNTRNLNDTYSSSPIIVDEIRNDNGFNGNNAVFSINASSFDAVRPAGVGAGGTLTGSPEFTFVTGFDRVDIENNSAFNIRVGNINVLNPSSQLALNVQSSAPNKTNFQPQNKGSSSGETKLKIVNNGNSDLFLDGLINNPSGSSEFVSPIRADLLIPGAGSQIVTASLKLQADAGKIGTAAAPLRTRSATGTDTTTVTSTSRGNFFLSHVSGNVGAASVVSTAGTVDFTVNGSILRSGTSSPNFDARPITLRSSTGSIGDASGSLQVETHGASAGLNAIAAGGIFITEVNADRTTTATQSLSVSQILSQTGNIELVVLDADSVGQDLFIDNNNSVQATRGSVTLSVGDNFMLNTVGSLRAGTSVSLSIDAGDDPAESPNLPTTAWIVGPVNAPAFNLNSGDDADEVSIRQIPAGTITTIRTGAGPDVVQIGSNAVPTTGGSSPRSNTDGTLNAMQARFTIDSGAGDDAIILDDSGDAFSNFGVMTANSLTGLGTSGGLVYSDPDRASLTVQLGSDNDSITIDGSSATFGTSFRGGNGDDRFMLGDTNNSLNALSGLVEIFGNRGSDSLSLTDSSDDGANAGTLSTTSITGLGMGASDAGVRYSSLESLSIVLGGGDDSLTITDIGTNTTIQGRGGNDTFNLGSRLSDVNASLFIDGGGGTDDTFNINSSTPTDITLKRSMPEDIGLIEGAAGRITYDNIDLLGLTLSTGNDTVRVEDTDARLNINTGDGLNDRVDLVSVRFATTVNANAGTDTISIFDAQAVVTVDGGTGTGNLTIDRSAGFGASRIGSIENNVVRAIAPAEVNFTNVDLLTVRLSAGNDVIRVDNTMPATRVAIDGGPGDDTFNLVRVGTLDTRVIGGSEFDTAAVTIAGFPQNRQFTNLSLDVESLGIDNSSNTLPVAWKVVNGIIEARPIPNGPKVDVIGFDGVGRTRIIAGTADDTLEVAGETGSDIPGLVDGNRVELSVGSRVVVPIGNTLHTIQNYDGVVGFDLTPSGKTYEEEEWFFRTFIPTQTAIMAGVSPSFTPRRDENFVIDQTGDSSAARGNFFNVFHKDRLDFRIVSLMLDGPDRAQVELKGSTLNGGTVTRRFTLDATPGFQTFIVNATAQPGFGALYELSVTGFAAAGSQDNVFLMDNVVLKKTEFGGPFSPDPIDVPTNGSTPTNREWWFRSDDANVVIDNNVDGQYNGFEGAYGSGASFFGVPLRVDFLSSGITEYRFGGELKIPDGTKIRVIGNRPVSIFAADDILIGSNVDFDVSVLSANPGAGPAGGGGGGASGSGSNGSNTVGGSGAGGSGGDFGIGAGGGGTGGDGGAASQGNQGGQGNPGFNNSQGGRGGGAGGTGGSAGTGSSGGGGGANGVFNGDNGGGGNVGGGGGNGFSGHGGSGGLNTVDSKDISGGGGGGAGGGGGGGGGAGGGGGGGGGGYGGGFVGGRGGPGGSGGTGGKGGDGGRGGRGGGALEIRAQGRIYVEGNNSSFSARGGAAATGSGGQSGSAGQNGQGGQGGGSGTFGSAGSGGAGAKGGTGGTGGTGGSGGGGSGGTIKLIASALSAANSRVDTSGAGSVGGGGAGGSGRFLFSSNVPGGKPTNLVGTNNSNTGTDVNQRFNDRVVETNPWLRGPSNSSVDTPMIVGLPGGADAGGLLGKNLFALPESVVNTIQDARSNFPDALAAVVRIAATDKTLSQTIGNSSFDTDDYTGFDLLLVVNMTSVSLTSPRLGISTVSGATFDAPLSVGGIAEDARFGGSGSRRTLNSLNVGGIFATLIPNQTVFVNASFGSKAEIENIQFSSNVSEQVVFVKASQDTFNVKDDLQGLENIVVSPDGNQIYGTSFVDAALATVNTENFTSRQLIKQGDVFTMPNGPSPVISMAAPVDIALAPNGQTLYLADFDGGLSVFRRDAQTGRMNTLLQNFTSPLTFSLAINEVGSRVFASGLDLAAFDVNSDGTLTFARSKNAFELLGFTSADRIYSFGDYLFATVPSTNTLFILRADTLDVVESLSGASKGLEGVGAIAKFGEFVYVTATTGKSITVFRQASDGKLTFIEKLIEGQDGVRGLNGVSDVVVTPRGGYVIVAGADSDSLSVFRRNPTDGKLTFVQIMRNGVGGAEGLLAPTSLAISPDGETLYVGSYGDSAAGIPGGVVAFPLAVYFLENASPAEAAVAAARNGSNLTTAVVLSFILDDVPIDVNIPAGNFANNDEMLTHIQSFITAAVTAAGKSNFGGIVARLDVQGIVRFAGLPTSIDIKTDFQSIKEVTLSTAGGQDNIRLIQSPNAETTKLTITTGANSDVVALIDLLPQIPGSPNTPTTIVNLGNGSDVAQLRSTRPNTSVIVNGGIGLDDIQIIATGPGQVTVANTLTATLVLAEEPSLAPRAVTRDTVKVNLANLDPTSTTTVRGNGSTILTYDTQGAAAIVAGTTLQVAGKGIVTYEGVGEVREIFPPIIRFVNPPSEITEGGSVSIEIEVQPRNTANQLNNPVAWDFDGDGVFGDRYGTGLFPGGGRETLTLTWSELVALGILDNRSYQIAFRAENEQGTSEAFFNLTVLDAPQVVSVRNQNQPDFDLPAADGSATIAVPYRIFFDARDPGSDRPQEWQVDWGDGSSEIYGSGIRSAVHSFARPGTFTVTVGVVDEDSTPNASATATTRVSVAVNNTGVSVLGGPFTVTQGNSLRLIAEAVGDVARMSWDLNNDGDFGDAAGKTPTVSWNELIALGLDKAGVYPIAVRARYQNVDGNGVNTSAVTSRLTVVNIAPQAVLSNSGPIKEAGAATVTFTNQTDPSPTDRAGLKYSFDFNNNGVFDAGVDIVDSTSSNANVPASLLAQSGMLTVRGVVKDPSDAVSEAYTSLLINDVAPNIVLSTTTPSLAEGAAFALAAQVVDPGADTITQWNIDWGDGFIENFAGNLRNFTHVYGDDGSYTVRAVAFDADGNYAATLATAVGVSNSLPILSELKATDSVEGGETLLTGKIADAGTHDGFTINVDWGDGQTEAIGLAAGTTVFSLGHRYLDGRASPYTINVSLNDDDTGNSLTGSTTVTVANALPTIASLSFPKSGYQIKEETTLIGLIVDPGLTDTHSVDIRWSDGTTSTAQVDPISRTFTAKHAFQSNLVNGAPSNVFSASVTVTDKDGATSAVGNASTNVLGSIPQAVEDKKSGKRNSSVDVPVLANDTDADGNNTLQPSTVALVMQPSVGTATVLSDGSIRFQPPDGFRGQVKLSYTVADAAQNVSNPALVTLDIVGSLFQNGRNRFDVNDDGVVSPIDVLVVINSIRRGGTRVIADGEPNPPYVDVDGDLSVAPLDVLQVINFLRLVRPNPEGEAATAISTLPTGSESNRVVEDDSAEPAWPSTEIDTDSILRLKRAHTIDAALAGYLE